MIAGRREEVLAKAQAELGERAEIKVCDVTDTEAVEAAVDLAAARFGGLDLAVNAAGMGWAGSVANMPAAEFEAVIDTNLSGVFRSMSAEARVMKQGDGGSIVNISSIAGALTHQWMSAYCASKAGLLGLMRSLASELTADKILVNALCPGWVNTAMAHEGLQGFANALSISKDEAYQKAMSEVPLGKMSEPEEIAKFICFLISDAQSSITGQTFDINNGAMMP